MPVLAGARLLQGVQVRVELIDSHQLDCSYLPGRHWAVLVRASRLMLNCSSWTAPIVTDTNPLVDAIICRQHCSDVAHLTPLALLSWVVTLCTLVLCGPCCMRAGNHHEALQAVRVERALQERQVARDVRVSRHLWANEYALVVGRRPHRATATTARTTGRTERARLNGREKNG